MVSYEKACRECEERFLAKRIDKNFCSSICKDRNYYRSRRVLKKYRKKSCKTCSSTFSPKTANNIYCSVSCKDKKARLRSLSGVKLKTKNKQNAKNTRKFNLMNKYGLSLEDYEQLFKKQLGLCQICKNPEKTSNQYDVKRLAVDHDHKTNIVRGLLCSNCNRGLGYFKDDRDMLIKAAKYLEEYNEK